MTDATKVFFLILSALFPIVDPLTGSPIFLSLTKNYSRETRLGLSRRVAFDSFYLMCGSYFVGSHVLRFLGVSLPVVQVGGGLIVTATGWKMLTQKDESRDTTRGNIPSREIFQQAFYPLTLPLTVGPGSISVAITLGANSTHLYGVHILIVLASIVAMSLIALSIFFCYGFADRLGQLLGETGTAVFTRLASFLLVCIGVQIAWNGFGALLSLVQFHSR